MNVVTYEDVSFNADALNKLSEQDFMDHEAHHGFSAEQLREAYKLIKAHPQAAATKPHIPYVASNKQAVVKQMTKPEDKK